MDVYANVLLKDNKIMFWYTGNKCNSEHDFNKDFYYAGLKIEDELSTRKYKLLSNKIATTNSNGYGEIENMKATEWYKQFKIHEEFKGSKPYEM